jgi:prophage regulatory protein
MTTPQKICDPIFRMNETCRQVALSRTTVYRLIDNGDFPQPIQLSKNSIGFLSSQIEAWKEQRIDDSRKAKEPNHG